MIIMVTFLNAIHKRFQNLVQYKYKKLLYNWDGCFFSSIQVFKPGKRDTNIDFQGKQAGPYHLEDW